MSRFQNLNTVQPSSESFATFLASFSFLEAIWCDFPSTSMAIFKA